MTTEPQDQTSPLSPAPGAVVPPHGPNAPGLDPEDALTRARALVGQLREWPDTTIREHGSILDALDAALATPAPLGAQAGAGAEGSITEQDVQRATRRLRHLAAAARAATHRDSTGHELSVALRIAAALDRAPQHALMLARDGRIALPAARTREAETADVAGQRARANDERERAAAADPVTPDDLLAWCEATAVCADEMVDMERRTHDDPDHPDVAYWRNEARMARAIFRALASPPAGAAPDPHPVRPHMPGGGAMPVGDPLPLTAPVPRSAADEVARTHALLDQHGTRRVDSYQRPLALPLRVGVALGELRADLAQVTACAARTGEEAGVLSSIRETLDDDGLHDDEKLTLVRMAMERAAQPTPPAPGHPDAARLERECAEQLELARGAIAERQACERDAERAIRAYSKRAEWLAEAGAPLANFARTMRGLTADPSEAAVIDAVVAAWDAALQRAALAPAPGEATKGEVDRG